MKGKAERVAVKKGHLKIPTSAQKRKTKPVDKFATDIPGKIYLHDLSNPAERKKKTGIGFELKSERGFSPYKKMNKTTNKVELMVFESVDLAKIHMASFEEKDVEARLALFVEGAKLCNLDQSYIDENKVIRAFSSNKGHHVFYQDISWKMINAGYIKLSSSKMIPNEDMNNFNLDGIDALKNHIYSLVAQGDIHRVLYTEEDMIMFEANRNGFILRAMLMTNRALINKNSARRENGLRALTFDAKSSKNTDFYLLFYTLPIKWYIDQVKVYADEVINELTKFETELLGSRCSTSYYAIDLRSGITFKEEEVKGNV